MNTQQALNLTDETKYSKESIKELLHRNQKAVIRGILAIYDRQTRDEQLIHTTIDHNGVGFSGCDAEILSSFAKQIQEGRELSTKQFTLAKKRILKYAGQLAKIANGEL